VRINNLFKDLEFLFVKLSLINSFFKIFFFTVKNVVSSLLHLDGLVDFREGDIQVVINITFSHSSIFTSFSQNNSKDIFFEWELWREISGSIL